MSPVFTARRADRFDSLVAGAPAGPRDAALDELLELVTSLRSVPTRQARSAFVSDLREQLMVAAHEELVPDPVARARAQQTTGLPPSRRTPRERRMAVAIGGLAIVGATTSMAVAAQGSLPGDTLYPVKLVLEDVHTHLTVTDDAKGSTLLANASGRLSEVDELTRAGQTSDVRVIGQTLQTFSEQAVEASTLMLSAYQENGDETAIEQLRDFTGSSIETLGQLESVVPDEARSSVLDAAETLYGIDSAAAQACPVCSGAGVTDLPSTLSLARSATTVVDAVDTMRALRDTGVVTIASATRHTTAPPIHRRHPTSTAPAPDSGPAGSPADQPTLKASGGTHDTGSGAGSVANDTPADTTPPSAAPSGAGGTDAAGSGTGLLGGGDVLPSSSPPAPPATGDLPTLPGALDGTNGPGKELDLEQPSDPLLP